MLKVTQMPFVKGQPRPLNAGRKKGTPNKKTLERMAREDATKILEAKALENDFPLDYMLRTMRDPDRRTASSGCCGQSRSAVRPPDVSCGSAQAS